MDSKAHMRRRWLLLAGAAIVGLIVLVMLVDSTPQSEQKARALNVPSTTTRPGSGDLATAPSQRVLPRPFSDIPAVLDVRDLLTNRPVSGAEILGADGRLVGRTPENGVVEFDALPSFDRIRLPLLSGAVEVPCDSRALPVMNGRAMATVPYYAGLKLRVIDADQRDLRLAGRIVEYPDLPTTNPSLKALDIDLLRMNRGTDPEAYLRVLGEKGLRPHPLTQRLGLTVVKGKGEATEYVPYQGQVVIKVAGSGILSLTSLVMLTPGAIVERSLTSYSPPVVAGRLVDEHDKGIARANVYVACHLRIAPDEFIPRADDDVENAAFAVVGNRLDGSTRVEADRATVSDASGRWSIEVPFTGGVAAYAYVPDKRRCVEIRTGLERMQSVRDIVLRAAVDAKGLHMLALNADDREPVAGARLSFAQKVPIDPWQLQYPDVPTDDKGRFSIAWFENSVEYDLWSVVLSDGTRKMLKARFKPRQGQALELSVN